MNYRKLQCISCGYTWESRSKKPRCPKCSKRRFNEQELEIPEYKPTTSKKIVNDAKKVRIEKEVEETLVDVETLPECEEIEEEPEEVTFSCSECQDKVKQGDLYCLGCGTRLLWEHVDEFNQGVE